MVQFLTFTYIAGGVQDHKTMLDEILGNLIVGDIPAQHGVWGGTRVSLRSLTTQAFLLYDIFIILKYAFFIRNKFKICAYHEQILFTESNICLQHVTAFCVGSPELDTD